MYNSLKIENQLCFPLYVCSKEIVRRYKPFLDKLDLTYTQYITMLIMWEHEKITSHELGEKLYLDSGTLTPVLKKLESKKYISRDRDDKDERNVIISITNKGKELKKQASLVPGEIGKCINLSKEEAIELYRLLYKLLGNIGE